jgi:hypothetical protein
MIVAIIALVAALGGSAYAATSLPANSVGSKQLKKNAVVTKKIKNHAVTASKINPAGLTVPNATHASTANTAGHAASASAVDGNNITSVDMAPATNTTTTIFSGDGLTLSAVCDSSTRIGINAQSSDPNAELNWFGWNGGTTSTGQRYDGTGTGVLNLISPTSYEGSIDIQFATTTGHTVTADLGTDYDNAFSTGSLTHCGVWGKVISS